MSTISTIFCSLDKSPMFPVGPDQFYDDQSILRMYDKLNAVAKSCNLVNLEFWIVPYLADSTTEVFSLEGDDPKVKFRVIQKFVRENVWHCAHLNMDEFDNLITANTYMSKLKHCPVTQLSVVPVIL